MINGHSLLNGLRIKANGVPNLKNGGVNGFMLLGGACGFQLMSDDGSDSYPTRLKCFIYI